MASYNTAGFTLYAGTSTIIAYGNASFYPGGKTYNDVMIISTSKNIGCVNDNNVFNTLIRRNGTELYFSGKNTINKLIIEGIDNSTNRLLIYTSSIGTSQKIFVNEVSACNVDFRDISAGGSANWDLSNIPGGSGDCGGNSGITFTPSTSCYFVHTSGTAY